MAITIPVGSRIYLDANVFIYAAEVPTAFSQLIKALERLDANDLFAVTSALTLAEVLVAHMHCNRRHRLSDQRGRIRGVAGLPVILLVDLA